MTNQTEAGVGNLFLDLPDASAAEIFTDLLRRPGCRIERIVSAGQTTPADHPCVQTHDEWVLLLAGSARIAMAGTEIALVVGDHLFIPAGIEHGVTFTDPHAPTVWLAIHIGESD
ncbi:MAG: cupin domain-containing protein [Gluconacetobacter diazotrophicus]|nr:cupin domain-containing protein [Gluconacetobacter diazotrophicus]